MINFSAFAEELEAIKEAGVLRDVALPWVKSGLRAVEQATRPQNVAPVLGEGGLWRSLKADVKALPQNAGKAVRAMGNPVEGVKRGVKYTADSLRGEGGTLNAALLGLGTLAAVPMVTSKEDPTGENMSRGGRMARFVGQQAGGLIGAPYGLGGALVGTTVGDAVGKKAGKLVDKVRGVKAKKAPEQSATVLAPQRMASVANLGNTVRKSQ